MVISKTISKAWKIWGLPLVLFFSVVVVSSLIFQHVIGTGLYEVDICEIVFAYGVSGCLVITCWVIMRQFQKINGRAVQKRTKICWIIFLALYVVSLVSTVILKLLTYFLYG